MIARRRERRRRARADQDRGRAVLVALCTKNWENTPRTRRIIREAAWFLGRAKSRRLNERVPQEVPVRSYDEAVAVYRNYREMYRRAVYGDGDPKRIAGLRRRCGDAVIVLSLHELSGGPLPVRTRGNDGDSLVAALAEAWDVGKREILKALERRREGKRSK